MVVVLHPPRHGGAAAPTMPWVVLFTPHDMGGVAVPTMSWVVLGTSMTWVVLLHPPCCGGELCNHHDMGGATTSTMSWVVLCTKPTMWVKKEITTTNKKIRGEGETGGGDSIIHEY